MTVEMYDPKIGVFTIGNISGMRRSPAVVLLLSGKVLLVGGTNGSGADLNTAELLNVEASLDTSRPAIGQATDSNLSFGQSFKIQGSLVSDLEASGGGSNNSAVNYPLVQLIALEGSQHSWLIPASQDNWKNPMTLTVSDLPATLNPGWHRLTVFTSGRASESRLVSLACGLVITQQPESQTVARGKTATFSVTTQGGRNFQWQRRVGQTDWVNIAGATGHSFTTSPVTKDDWGAEYQVIVTGGCKSKTSLPATLSIQDDEPPKAEIHSPSGGDYWFLSEEQQITWSMSDDVGICKVEVFLEYLGGRPRKVSAC